MAERQGFVLSRQWRDTQTGVELEYWLSTDTKPVKLILSDQSVVFFLPENQLAQADSLLQQFFGAYQKSLPMRDFSGQAVVGCYFNSQRKLREAKELLLAHQLDPLESDINPYDRFLMERFIRGSLRYRGDEKNAERMITVRQAELIADDYKPTLKVISLDIETAMQGVSLYSIAVYAVNNDKSFAKVFMLSGQAVSADVDVFRDEKQLLLGFLTWLAEYDPDIIIGWNVVNFDFWYLQQVCEKHHIPFRCGRGKKGYEATAHFRQLGDEGNRYALSIPGRVVLDGIELLKAAFYQFESFSLSNVADKLLEDSKLIEGNDRGEKITELFHRDKSLLAKYNVHDCKLVWDIFEKTKLLDFAIARTRMTGLPLERIGGSVASFDFRYLPLLHRQSYVAPNGHWLDEIEASPGGYVMDSKPGIYNHVIVLDFKSLYPSIIRSFKIDPLGMAVASTQELDQSELVPGFKGGWFAKEKHLLPGIITELWQQRDEAKANNDKALSQAIKIIMNSFYGVLGSGGCRFFDPRLASSITRRGHQIIQQTAEYIEQQGWSVIYGDTDSVFVWLKGVADTQQVLAIGSDLAKQLNTWWRQKLLQDYQIDSSLELEFETHYQRFLMPTVRGSELGSKKRYAGVVIKNNKPELVFKGLENVRTDWTRLARNFQLELYRRVFFDEPYRAYVKKIVAQVLLGDRDKELVYRKRLRRKLNDYQRNVPPHAQAARKAVESGKLNVSKGDWIEYVITTSGAEPLVDVHSPIDYQHYIDRQLAPAADGILYFLKDSLADIIDQQISLFGE